MMSTEKILNKLKENPSYISRVSSELKKDINFGKLAVLINSKLYISLSENVQNNDEVVQIILDNAKYSSLLPSYLITQDNDQKEQLLNIRKSMGYLDLYISITGTYDKDFDNINLNELAQNKEFFKEMKRLINLLMSPSLVDLIKLKYGLEDGIPKTSDELSKIYGISIERINQQLSVSMRKLKENYNKKYNNSKILVYKNR